MGEGFCGGKRSPLLNELCRGLIWLVLFHRYEEEINRRTAAENEFVVLKKVGEMSCMDAEPPQEVHTAGALIGGGPP